MKMKKATAASVMGTRQLKTQMIRKQPSLIKIIGRSTSHSEILLR